MKSSRSPYLKIKKRLKHTPDQTSKKRAKRLLKSRLRKYLADHGWIWFHKIPSLIPKFWSLDFNLSEILNGFYFLNILAPTRNGLCFVMVNSKKNDLETKLSVIVLYLVSK